MARPKFKLDWDAFDRLLHIGCTLREAAQFFECDERTIEACIKREKKMGFCTYAEQKELKTRIGIKRKMIEKALHGDNTMLIWCSKNLLGWAEKLETKNENSNTSEPIICRISWADEDAKVIDGTASTVEEANTSPTSDIRIPEKI